MTTMDHQEISGQKGSCRWPESLGSTTAYGINDAAEPLKDEDRGPVVIQIVALGCLNAHSHEGLGFRFCTCQKSKQSSQLGEAIHTETRKMFWMKYNQWQNLSAWYVFKSPTWQYQQFNWKLEADFYSHITFCLKALISKKPCIMTNCVHVFLSEL